ncbi:hypothetical protein D8S93_23945 [Vibrio sp. VGrn 2]|uniref:hypothetical protein n=1 Tax=Vibrio sp. VGrn 2 TaxID=2419839 RepID=UPI00128BC540|nr:hypothetical protein [Vibrio sp. VGrn 2]MPS41628.1 hypothetical protein [Vibrio sp. VGrn 2]
MLDFLNQTIGVDIATYISLGLAVVGIFFGAKFSKRRLTQSQDVKRGNGIQTTGNVKLEINYGRKDKD